MSACIVIDTYPDFMKYWSAFCQKPIEAQINGWASTYMANWPELLNLQIKAYANETVDWREVAREKIFPFLQERQIPMQVAHDFLLTNCQPIYTTAQQMFNYDVPLICVLYVGIGLGAGWATTYQNSSALLFGLENIAEEGWCNAEGIKGLIAHEIGHLVYFHYRAQAGKPIGSGPWWDLYTEGFAQRCEHILLGKDNWHMALGTGYPGWLSWCKENEPWLAADFLRRVKCGEDVRPFFGSWFQVQGQKQTGYFLGHELVKRLETQYSLEQIAVIDEIDPLFEELLVEIAREDNRC